MKYFTVIFDNNIDLSIHQNYPKHCTNPDVFDPKRYSLKERWTRSSGIELLFVDGSRFCPGTIFFGWYSIFVLLTF